MLLSVIIPIYNVEDYLIDCINSVLKQDINDLEIILVDDGSPDSCPEICDDYAKKYEQIKVLHKKNDGLSEARNDGVKLAKGEYIMFLDSDDWWNPNVNVNHMLSLVKQKRDIDMFLFSSLDYIENDGYYKRTEHDKLSKVNTDCIESYYHDLLQNGNLEISAATKILKRKFILDNNLFFKKGIISEDNEWILRLLRKSPKIEIINEPLYIYRYGRIGSITNTIKYKNVKDILDIVNSSLKFYHINQKSQLKQYELCYCAYLWFSALGMSFSLSYEDKKSLKEIFKETSEVCNYSDSPKTKLAFFVYKIFGLNITTIILGKYILLKGKKNINKRRVDN